MRLVLLTPSEQVRARHRASPHGPISAKLLLSEPVQGPAVPSSRPSRHLSSGPWLFHDLHPGQLAPSYGRSRLTYYLDSRKATPWGFSHRTLPPSAIINTMHPLLDFSSLDLTHPLALKAQGYAHRALVWWAAASTTTRVCFSLLVLFVFVESFFWGRKWSPRGKVRLSIPSFSPCSPQYAPWFGLSCSIVSSRAARRAQASPSPCCSRGRARTSPSSRATRSGSPRPSSSSK